MKFAFRKKEIQEIARLRWLSEEQHTRVALITGPDGIGKKSLVQEALKGRKILWIDAEMQTEKLMAQQLNMGAGTLDESFDLLFRKAEEEHLILVIENADRLETSAPAALARLAALAHDRKRKTVLFLCLLSSSRNFHFGQPNTVDTHLKIDPFTIRETRELLTRSNPEATGEDALALYAASGGVPQYIGWLLDREANTADRIRTDSLDPASPVSHLGKNLLARTLGSLTPVYASILSLLAEGCQSAPQIQERMGMNVGGHLARLEEDYGLVKKTRPPFAKEGARNLVRVEIQPLELLWWFLHAGGAAQTENNRKLLAQRYFRDKLVQEEGYVSAEGWWNPASGETFDIVAFPKGHKALLVGDLCKDKAAVNNEAFKKKLLHFQACTGMAGALDTRLFSQEDL